MKFINLTPHTVKLIKYDGDIIAEFPSEGYVQVKTRHNYHFNDEGIPTGKIIYEELINMPEPKENTIYILSTISFNAAKAKGRNDVCFPAGYMYRDEDGQIKGCEFLAYSYAVKN